MEQELLYRLTKDLSIERCHCIQKDTSLHLRSELIANTGKKLYGIDYHLVLDPNYKVCFFQLSYLCGSISKEVVGHRLAEHWVIDNLPNVAIPYTIVIDVDLSCFTKNYILKACDLQIGQSKAIEVLTIEPRDASFFLNKHTYHRTSPTSYLMQVRPNEPWVTIEVDADGFIKKFGDKYVQIPQ
ncbi:putative glycolipid-binding domain-containing protein [Myroides sp. LJL116]